MSCVCINSPRRRTSESLLISLLLTLYFSISLCFAADISDQSLQKEIEKHYSLLANSDDEAELTRACISLMKLGPKAKHLIPDLFDLTRECSLWTSGYVGWVLQAVSDGSEREIIKYLDDTDPNVVSTALLCLRKPNALPSEVLLEHLLPYLEEESWRRSEALIVLETMGSDARPAIEVLVKILRSEDVLNRRIVPSILRNIGVPDESALSALRQTLTDPDKVLQAQAAVALQTLCPEKDDGIQRLIVLLSDSDGNTRRNAARALGRIGVHSDLAQKKLQAVLKDPNKQVRVWATFALYRMDKTKTIHLDALMAYSKSKDPILQNVALLAMSELGPEAKRVLPQIIHLLNHEEPMARLLAINALSELGPVAEPALPALRAKLNPRTVEPSATNGFHAIMALRAIQTIESQIKKSAPRAK